VRLPQRDVSGHHLLRGLGVSRDLPHDDRHVSLDLAAALHRFETFDHRVQLIESQPERLRQRAAVRMSFS